MLAVVIAFNDIVNLLGSQSLGRFQVIGYQDIKKSSETIIDNPLVQCWIDSVSVDWSRSSRNGPKEHTVRIKIQFTVSQPAKADLSILENPDSTDAQRAAALSNLTTPAQESTTALYSAWSAVYEILDDARNITFGLPRGAISNKSYSDFNQDTFPPEGGLGILTASSTLEFMIKESQLGEIGNQPTQVIGNSNLYGSASGYTIDEISQMGILEKNPP